MDCADECPDDSAHILAGPCGCGQPVVQSDGDGIPDCVDTCDAIINPDPIAASGIDLLVPYSNEIDVAFRPNNDPPAAALTASNTSGGYRYAAGDFNGDGRDDVVTATNEPAFRVMTSLGNGTLGPASISPIPGASSGNSATALVTGDFDEDGLPDAAMCSGSDGLVHVARGIGTGRLQYLRSFSASNGNNVNRMLLVSGDFDEDGHLDLAANLGNSGQIGLFSGDGRGVFNLDVDKVLTTTSSDPLKLLAHDLDNDGALDLVVFADYWNITVFMNRFGTGGGFELAPGCDQSGCPYRTSQVAYSLTVADFTGDGIADIQIPFAPGGELFIGDGSGRFTRRLQDQLMLTHPAIAPNDPCHNPGNSCARPFRKRLGAAPVAGDFTGDGRVDLALHGYLNYQTQVPALCEHCNKYVLVIVELDAYGMPLPNPRVFAAPANESNSYGLLALHLDGPKIAGDQDADGAGDDCDLCASDANKVAPGICLCGNAETDTDHDGSPDCVDECDSDPHKSEIGDCGCFRAERDGDLDGTPDCIDTCPDLPALDQNDSDSDGYGDACETCDNDPDKVAPGGCGCGTPDRDNDRDGVLDCVDPDDDDDGQCDAALPVVDVCTAGPDRCVFEPNAPFTDIDNDNQGEACGDYDLDNDGTCDPGCPSSDPDLECSGHGRCVPALGCLCHDRWGGVDCRTPLGRFDLECPGNCNGAGVCDRSTGLCICENTTSGFECLGPASGQETGGQCEDLWDNDNDGRTDCADPSCAAYGPCGFCPVADCHGLTVGDPCVSLAANLDGLEVAGTCFRGEGADEGEPCVGDCLCRFAVAGTEIAEVTVTAPLDLSDEPVCPCFDRNDVIVWQLSAEEIACELAGANLPSCELPAWTRSQPGTGTHVDVVQCEIERASDGIMLQLAGAFPACGTTTYTEAGSYFVQHVLTAAQVEACSEVLDLLRDPDGDGNKDCPNDCSGHGICDRATGQCRCYPDINGDTWSGSDCSSLYASPEQGSECFDGYDNNDNGQTDCAELGCALVECDCPDSPSDSCRGRAVGDACQPFSVSSLGEPHAAALTGRTGVCYGGPDRPEDTLCFGECTCLGGIVADRMNVETPPTPVPPAQGDGCPCFDVTTFVANIGLIDADECDEDNATLPLTGCAATLPEFVRRQAIRIGDDTIVERTFACEGSHLDPFGGGEVEAWVDTLAMQCVFGVEDGDSNVTDFAAYNLTEEQLRSCQDIMRLCTRDNDRNGIADCIDGAPELPVPDLCTQGPDNCLDQYNPALPGQSQSDADEDGVGDECDDCPLDPENDKDNDGVCGDLDVCPDDADNDACNPDVDGDGVCDAANVGNASECDTDADCLLLSVTINSGNFGLLAFGCHEHRCRLSADYIASQEPGSRCDTLGGEVQFGLGLVNEGVREGHCENDKGLCIPGAADPNGLCIAGDPAPPECQVGDPNAASDCRLLLDDLGDGDLDPSVPVTCHLGMCLFGDAVMAERGLRCNSGGSFLGNACRIELATPEGVNRFCAPRALVGDDACDAPDGGTAGCRDDLDCLRSQESEQGLTICSPEGRCEFPAAALLQEHGIDCNHPELRFYYFGEPRCTPADPGPNDICGYGEPLPNGLCPVNTGPVDCTFGPDNCPTERNEDQLDHDRDGIGDECDDCAFGDDDNDTVCSGVDNCPTVANTDQVDSDVPSNGFGDACEPDADDDGTCDEAGVGPIPQCTVHSDCFDHLGFYGDSNMPPEQQIGCVDQRCRWRETRLRDDDTNYRCDGLPTGLMPVLGVLNGGVRESHCRDAEGFCVPGASIPESGLCSGDPATPECNSADLDADDFCAQRFGFGEVNIGVACVRDMCAISAALFQVQGVSCGVAGFNAAFGARMCVVEVERPGGRASYCVPVDVADGACEPPDGGVAGCLDDQDCERQASNDSGSPAFSVCGPDGFCEPTVGTLAANGATCADALTETLSAGPRCTPTGAGPDTICGFGRALEDGSCPRDPRPMPCALGPDNCVDFANDQSDDDNDTIGDDCDLCRGYAPNDEDGDGVCGNIDNCPLDPNPDQRLVPCDPDHDEDGVCDRSGFGSGVRQCRSEDDCQAIYAAVPLYNKHFACIEGRCRVSCETLADNDLKCDYFEGEQAAFINAGVDAEHCCNAQGICMPGGSDDNATRACDDSVPQEGCSEDDNCTTSFATALATCQDERCLYLAEYFDDNATGDDNATDPCNTFDLRLEQFKGRQHCSREVSPGLFACVPDGFLIDGHAVSCEPECGPAPDHPECPDELLGCGSDGLCAVRCDQRTGTIDLGEGATTCDDPSLGYEFGFDYGTGCCGSEGLCVNAREGTFECVPAIAADCAFGPDNCVPPNGISGQPDFVPASSFNPTQADDDNDSIGNICDECPDDAINDPDDDNLCGLDDDNCPFVFNPDQSDPDLDGLGVPCDVDNDDDGVCDPPGYGGACRSDAECEQLLDSPNDDENMTIACVDGNCRVSCQSLTDIGLDCSDRRNDRVTFYTGVDTGEHCCSQAGYCVPGGDDDNATACGAAPRQAECQDDYECEGAFGEYSYDCPNGYCQSVCHQGECLLLADQLYANGPDGCNTAFARWNFFDGKQACAARIRPDTMACLPAGPDNICAPECEPGHNYDTYGRGCGDPALVCGDAGLCTYRCEAARELGGCSAREVGQTSGFDIGTGCCGDEGYCIAGNLTPTGQCVLTIPADCRTGPDNCVDDNATAFWLTQNADQADPDGDGVGVPCDKCPQDPLDDADMDGACADVDNCPTVANGPVDENGTLSAGFSDSDRDLIGDLCDNDVDGDGYCNERCPNDCSGHGRCPEDDNQTGCLCDEGYGGVDCSEDLEQLIPCPGDPPCYGVGVCNPTNGSCYCDSFIGGLNCQGTPEGEGPSYEDNETLGTCDDEYDNDQDGSVDCMDAGCAKADSCAGCSVFVECNSDKRVGDTCTFAAPSQGFAIAGVCYGGEQRDDTLPCAGDCVCRFAGTLDDDNASRSDNMIEVVDISEQYPLTFVGCPCFGEDDLYAMFLPDNNETEGGCGPSPYEILNQGCAAGAPRWANPFGTTISGDPTRDIFCQAGTEERSRFLILASGVNLCESLVQENGGITGRAITMTEAQEASCVALLEAWRTDVDADGLPDVADPAVVLRCPGAPPCSNRGLCNADTGACFCEPGFKGAACDYTEEDQPEIGSEYDCNDGVDNDGDGLTDCADARCRETGECTFCGITECNDGGHAVGDDCDFIPDVWGLFLTDLDVDTNGTRALGPPSKGLCYGGAGGAPGRPCVGQCACVGGTDWSLAIVAPGQNDCPDTNLPTAAFDGSTEGEPMGPEGTACGGGPLDTGEGVCVGCDSYDGCSCIGGAQEELAVDLAPVCPCFTRQDLARLLDQTVSICLQAPLELEICTEAEKQFLPWIRDREAGLAVGTARSVFPPLWGPGPEESSALASNTWACAGVNIPGIPPGVIEFDASQLNEDDFQLPPDLIVDIQLVTLVKDNNLCVELGVSTDIEDLIGLGIRRITDTQEDACQEILDDCLIMGPTGFGKIRDSNRNFVPDCLEEEDVVVECIGADNCPTDPNYTQVNSDEDSLGDACDDCPTITLSADGKDVSCDGLDDNCNGTDDEDFVGQLEHCGTGACAASGTTVCVLGMETTTCDDGEPIAEVCGNSVDDDCNGETDDVAVIGEICDGLDDSDVCPDGLVVCGADSLPTCDDGGPDRVEICDGVDNDCNGQTDEGCDDDGDEWCDVTMVCVAGGVTAPPTCLNGCGDCDDSAIAVFPGAVETCNDVDDDCGDGVDEGCDDDDDGWCDVNMACSGTPLVCGFGCGDCKDLNVDVFPNGPESCNLRDDNCNLVVDEGFTLGGSCSNGVGECARPGVMVCAAGGAGTICNALPGAGVAESCNGLDDDCDGFTDDGLGLGDGCSVGVGECLNTGVKVCKSGAVGCSATEDLPNTELCNEKDDDCDGETDNGFDVGSACDGIDADSCPDGNWQCALDGTRTCVDGPEVGVEICDGIDNDCNGGTDEGCDDDGDDYCDADMRCVAGGGQAPAICIHGCGDCDDDAIDVNPGAVEKCNDIDDDCGAGKDEGPGIDEGCDDDNDGWCDFAMACSGNPLTCAAGCGDCDDLVVSVFPGASELCNGRDDNCNLAIIGGVVSGVDESFALGLACSSGVGECAESGHTVCAPGGAGTTCDATPGTGISETCNGLDDDCDGFLDDGLGLGEACSVGVGECLNPGIKVCQSGAVGCSATADPAGVELCNGLDDDCNGVTDNGFEVGAACDGDDADACLDGSWQCVQSGVRACVDGPEVGVEICDSLDNDCDGNVDEGCDDDGDDFCDAGMRCVAGGGQTPTTCMHGCGDCDDAAFAVKPTAIEACNGVDEDCDGAIDDGCDDDDDGWCDFSMACSGTPLVCGFGCGDCKDLVANVFPTGPERCNGADDNCNNQIDEGFTLGATCSNGVGACARPGHTICAPGGAGTTCDATPGTGVGESCNGLDDDCDGFTDDGLGLGDLCSVGVGECLRSGVKLCAAGQIACSVTAGAPQDEVCNGKDDDCQDGIDNGFDVGTACDGDDLDGCRDGLWQCAQDGTRTCVDGPEVGVEICDGSDNNCNGVTDEGCDDDGDHFCDAGMRCVTGVVLLSCVSGCGDCNDTVAAVNPSAVEACNDIDDDCGGDTDEGCDDDDDGWCDFAMACSGTHGVCALGCGDCKDLIANVFPGAAESCNNLDDNCNNVADEGFALGGQCSSGVGACVTQGAMICAPDNSGTTCGAIPGTGVGESCNGIDDDCDGFADEDFGLGLECEVGRGECRREGVRVCAAGAGACSVTAPAGGAELCDRKDNDCDGVTDNGFEQVGTACDGDDTNSCLDGLWQCALNGAVSCVDGPELGVEICDGIDNNCKDGVDEGCDDDGDHFCDALMTCVGGGGVTPSSCVLGCGDCNDLVAGVNPAAAETCNNVDDDCQDGIDEGCDDDQDGWCDFAMVCSGTPTVCGFGCGDCKDLSAGVFPNATESCNGQDDNCNGSVDEGFTLGATCTAGVGVCAAQGKVICAAGGGGTTCGAVAGTGSNESCNGSDDDCDGSVDEGFGLGVACSAGLGECQRAGVTVCAGGGTACSATAGGPFDEICDGKDNNCNGATDEGATAFADRICAPLETQILTGPQSLTGSSDAFFTFLNPVTPTNTAFDCSLDGAGWTPCDGGATSLFGVPVGSHVLLVRARGPDLSVDTTPAFHVWRIDKTVPDTIILAGPDDPSQSGSAVFLFGASVSDADHWMCALDSRNVVPRSTDYVVCPAYWELEGLADGPHVLWVYVVDSKGAVDPQPAKWNWTIDRSAPETAITSGPTAYSADDAASFAFVDPEDASVTHFECRLDDGEWASCDGGTVAYANLDPGQHVFSVRSVDDAGSVDPTPDTYVWTIDVAPPDTSIPVHPDALTQSPRATFGFASNESPVTFECALDPAVAAGQTQPAERDWDTCDATEVFAGLQDGPHVIWVRAVDEVGLVDGSPARFEWVIDTRSPETAIDEGPPAQLGAGEDASFGYENPEDPDHDGFECRVDGGAWQPCDGGTSTLEARDMTVGAHTFEVRSCVDDGPPELRCDPSPAIWRWAVSESPCPLDGEAPVMVCVSDLNVECFAGRAEVDLAALAPSVSDVCGEPVSAREGGDPMVLGQNPVVFYASDANGNTASCLTVVSVVDTLPPTITCPGDVAVDNDPGLCSAAPEIGEALVGDGCDAVAALVVVSDAPPLFPVGVTTVTHRVIDGAGHAAECTQRVTVSDVELPVLTCIESISVDAPADACVWEGALSADSATTAGDRCSWRRPRAASRWASGRSCSPRSTRAGTSARARRC